MKKQRIIDASEEGKKSPFIDVDDEGISNEE
jgi:hypothetical protein